MRSRDRLGCLTDTRALPTSTQVVDRGSYRVIRTADYASFWFGNLLSLDVPPAVDSLSYWFDVCRRELGDLPRLQRLVLDWETDLGAPYPAEALPVGMTYEGGTVLRLRSGSFVPRMVLGFDWRPVLGDGEWEAVVSLACDEFGDAAFERWRLQAYREKLATTGGHWWGAWQGGLLVGSCGLFEAPDYLRFQEVVTHRAYRRQGVCSALCAAALQDAWRRHPRAEALIVAEQDSHAERLYRRLGFEPVGLQHAVLMPV